MKRYVLIFLLIVIVGVFGQTEVTLLGPENFDTYLPAGWGQNPPHSDDNDWHQGTFPGGGTNCAIVEYEAYNDDSLFTAPFDASAGFDSVVIEVLEDYELFGGGGSGSSYILMSSDDGATWETAYTYGREGIDSEVNRYRVEFWTGSSFNAKACFWYDNDDDVWWALDDVTVYGYLPSPEPAAPSISHLGPRLLYPSGTSSVPVLAYLNDYTGVEVASVELCYSVNGEPYTCYPMTYEDSRPDGSGNYTFTIPDLVGWDELEYYIRAEDTYFPESIGSTEVFSTLIEGPYYIYEDHSGYPMQPDTEWVSGTTEDLDAIEADDARIVKTALPFPIVFYGTQFDSIWVCSNGWLKFGEDPEGNWFWTEYIPTVDGVMNNFLAWCWSDLTGFRPGPARIPGPPEAKYYEDPSGDYIVFSFENWHQLGDYDTAFNCQVQIWNPEVIPQPGGCCAIDVRFEKLPRDLDIPEMGIENFTGEMGTAYLHTGGTYGHPSYSFYRRRTIRYSTQPPPSGLIYGNVNLEGSSDNSGAEVGCVGFSFSDVSSITGNYRVETVPPGTYDVYCYHPDYHPDTVYGVVVSFGDSVELNFSLEPRTAGFIEGWADLSDTGPIGDGGIQIVELRTGLTATTDATGYFFIDGVRIGDVQIMASHTGYYPDYTPVLTLAEGETLDTDAEYGLFTLDPIIPTWIEDFEIDDGGATASGLWEWGSPIIEGPPSAHGGANCWGTNIDDNYTTAYMTPPAGTYTLNIPVPSVSGTMLSFWQWMEAEEYGGEMADGGNFQISTDGGTSWITVTDPIPPYDGNIDASFGNPMGGEEAWGFGPTDWRQTILDISGLGPITNILMRFGTDNFSSLDAGWYLDDFAISNVGPYTGAVEGYVYNCSSMGVIENARVSINGLTEYTDASGYFFFDNVPYGENVISAIKYAYFMNSKDISVFIDDTVFVLLEICPIASEEVSGQLAYGEDDTVYFEVCNTSEDTVWYSFPPLPLNAGSGSRSGSISLEVGPNPSDPNARSRSLRSGSEDRSETRASGDIWQIYPANECDIAWGIAVPPNVFWVGDVLTYQYNHVYNRPVGDYTGSFYDVTGVGGSDWMADMCWDPLRGVVWQIAVGSDNGIYAIDPATGAIVDSLFDPLNIWDAASQRGIGFDAENDIFYIGGWNRNLIYKVKGPSWADAGASMNAFTAPGCAGVCYHPIRQTIWFAVNDTSNRIAEIDPATNTIIDVLTVPAPGDYALAGLGIDERGRFWVVDQNENDVYVIEGPTAGMYIEPQSGYFLPGECITFSLINDAWTTPVGDYCFDIDFFYGDISMPYSIPTCVQVQPRAEMGWELITVPLHATPNDPAIQFSDDITPFSVDPTSSNIYGYNQDAGIMELPDGFVRGKGYFLLSWLDNTYWDVYGTPFEEGDFTYTLYYPEDSPNWGWWLLGNPFNRRLDWDAVYAANDFTYMDPEYFLWSRKNGWTWYSPIVGGGGEDNLIDAWRGFFAYVHAGNPDYYTYLTYPAEGTMPTFLAKTAKGKVVETVDPHPFALRVSVRAQSGSDIRNDIYNYFSVHALASDGFGEYDVREPSIDPPGNSVKSFFRNGVFNLTMDTKQNFSSSTKTWTFRVEDLSAGMEVTLMWPGNRMPTGDDASYGVENLDSRWNLTLRDNIIDEELDMRSDTSYTFTYGSAPRVFTITLSDLPLGAPEIDKPEKFALGPNIPNPFNASTQFVIEIPEATDVRVEIFDLLGRQVATLVDGQMEIGWHRVIWDGLDDSGDELPSGIYLYRVTAGDFKQTRKMTLIK